MSKNNRENQLVRAELIKIYGKICMLGDEITEKNYITLHHIEPYRIVKITTIENGALLGVNMHGNINFIEKWYYTEAQIINEYLKYYKATQDKEEMKKMNLHVKKLTLELRSNKKNICS